MTDCVPREPEGTVGTSQPGPQHWGGKSMGWRMRRETVENSLQITGLMFNTWHAEFSIENVKLNMHVLSFLDIEMPQKGEMLCLKHKDLHILSTQYHGYWWPGDARSQGISGNGIELVLQEYHSLNTRRVNHTHSSMVSHPGSIIWSFWYSEPNINGQWNYMYCQTSNIRHTKSPNLNVSCLILQMSLPNPLKAGVKSRMKM